MPEPEDIVRPRSTPHSNVPLVQGANARPGELVPDLRAGDQAIRVRGSDGKLHWRAPGTILDDLRSGQYTVEPGNSYRLEDDYGNEFEVDGSQLANALRWHEEDPDNNARLHIAGMGDELARAQRDASGALGTFAESAGRAALSGATVGIADAVEGVVDLYRDPTEVAREQRRRAAQEAENPASAFAGSVAGTIGPALLTGGASALGTAATGARAATGAARVGRLGIDAVTALPRAAAGAGEAAASALARRGVGSVTQAVAREAVENATYALPATAAAAVDATPDTAADAAEAAYLSGATSLVGGTVLGLGVRGAAAGLGRAREVIGEWATRGTDTAALRALQPRGRDLYNNLGNATIRPELLRQFAPEALEAAGVSATTATDAEIARALADEMTRRTVNSAYVRNYLALMADEVPDVARGPNARRVVRAMEFGDDVERIAENVDDLKGAALRHIEDGLEGLSRSAGAEVRTRDLVDGIASALDRTRSPHAASLADDQVMALEQEIEHVLLGAVRNVGQESHGFRPRVFRVDMVGEPGLPRNVAGAGETVGESAATQAARVLGIDDAFEVRSARVRRGAHPNDETAPVGTFLDLFRPSRANPDVTVGDELLAAANRADAEGNAIQRWLFRQTSESADARATLIAYKMLRDGTTPMETLVKIRRGLDDIAYRHSQETNATAPATVAMRTLGKDIAGVFRRTEQQLVDGIAASSPDGATAAAKYRHGQSMFQVLEMVQPTANIASYAQTFRNRRMSLSDYNTAQVAAAALTGAAMSTKGAFILLASTANSLVRTRLDASLVAARRRMMRAEALERSVGIKNEMTRKMVRDAIGMHSAPAKRQPSLATAPRTAAAVGREFVRARERLDEMERSVNAAEHPDLRETAEVAPQTAVAIRTHAASLVDVLRSRLPASASRAAPGVDETLPSREEMERFIEDMRIAENPVQAFAGLLDDPLPVESARLMQRLYPRAFAEVQRQIQEALVEGKFRPTYFQRIRLSLLFGMTIEPTMQPSYISVTQGIAASGGDTDETLPAGRGNRPVSLGSSDAATTSERVSARAVRRNEP